MLESVVRELGLVPDEVDLDGGEIGGGQMMLECLDDIVDVGVLGRDFALLDEGVGDFLREQPEPIEQELVGSQSQLDRRRPHLTRVEHVS